MARQKRRDSTAPLPRAEARDPGAAAPFRIGVIEWVAGGLILLAMSNAWFARYELSPDGVAYLDLTARLLAGDGAAFVQGYWSPVYPTLIALFSSVGGKSPTALLTLAHLINGGAIAATVLLLWWWGRKSGGTLFAPAAFAALFLVSYGLPRIEAVTPDLLLLALMTWLGYELLVEQGRRWWMTGFFLGVIYLVKTSAWPWLLLSIPLRLWGAREAEGRRDVIRSLLVALPMMLLWVVPLSVKAGHPTFGSAGRLNYCWYIEGCDSRTPDGHVGEHVAYHHAVVDSSRSVTWAEFDAERWTYEPWSDPTSWEAGVVTRTSHRPELEGLLRYWGRIAWRSISLWFLPLLAGVLLPWSLPEWRAERRRWWTGTGRPTLAVMLLGGAGIVQFILIHAEPRLLAPYGMLMALAVLNGGTEEDAATLPTGPRRSAGWIGLILVAGAGYLRLKDVVGTGRQWEQTLTVIANANTSMAAEGISQARIVVLGPGIPAMVGAFVSGAHVVAQLPPRSVTLLDQLPVERRQQLLRALFGGRAQIAWRTNDDGSFTFVKIPPN